VRWADIPPDVHDFFERVGEYRLREMFSRNLVPDQHDDDLLKIYGDEHLQQQARQWLFEQQDKHDRHNRRLGVLAVLGTVAAIVAAFAGVRLLLEQEARWNSEDRPQLIVSSLQIPPGLDRFIWRFVNVGKGDATNISITIATLNSDRTLFRLCNGFSRTDFGMVSGPRAPQ
jgi:hypothetical protein